MIFFSTGCSKKVGPSMVGVVGRKFQKIMSRQGPQHKLEVMPKNSNSAKNLLPNKTYSPPRGHQRSCWPPLKLHLQLQLICLDLHLLLILICLDLHLLLITMLQLICLDLHHLLITMCPTVHLQLINVAVHFPFNI